MSKKEFASPKFLLLNPPKRVFFLRYPYSRWFPLGLTYVASYVRNKGFQVRVFDAMAYTEDSHVLDKEESGFVGLYSRPGASVAYHLGSTWERIQEYIKYYQPDVLGLSCLMTAHRPEVIHIGRLAKELDAQIKVVAGGPDASVSFDKLLASGVIDFVIRGDGELGMAKLLKAILNNEKLRNVPGLVYLNNGRCVINPISYLKEKELNDLYPAVDLFPMEQWFKAAEMRFAMLITSRGCPHACTFCSQRKTRYRVKSIESVMHEIQMQISLYNIDTLLFEDDMLLSKPERAYELFNRIAKLSQKFKIHLFSGISPAKFDKRLADAMYRAGVISLPFGVETYQKKIMKSINKKFVTKKKVQRAIEIAQMAKIPDTRVFLIAGLPGSKLAHCLDDIKYAFQQGARVNLNSYYPIPNTPLYRYVLKRGYIISQEPSHFRGSYGNIETPKFSRAHLLCLLDYYQALKILSRFSSLTQCLEAYSVEKRPSTEFSDQYFIKVFKCECQHLSQSKGKIGLKYCQHFANYLAVWFSLCSERYYKVKEIACRLTGQVSACTFFMKEEEPYPINRYVLMQLREVYKRYKKKSEKNEIR